MMAASMRFVTVALLAIAGLFVYINFRDNYYYSAIGLLILVLTFVFIIARDNANQLDRVGRYQDFLEAYYHARPLGRFLRKHFGKANGQ